MPLDISRFAEDFQTAVEAVTGTTSYRPFRYRRDSVPCSPEIRCGCGTTTRSGWNSVTGYRKSKTPKS
jgi:hypothetical protein